MESIIYRRHPSLPTIFCGNNGEVFSLKTGIFLKQQKGPRGYSCFSVGRSTKKTHRIVLESFVGLSSLQVDHINGIKTDNRLCNLEYVTNRENFNRSIKNGRSWDKIMGEKNFHSKLAEACVLEILKTEDKSIANKKLLAKKYKVSRSTINDILKRRSWKHL